MYSNTVIDGINYHLGLRKWRSLPPELMVYLLYRTAVSV
jgi:hypothetical protein